MAKFRLEIVSAEKQVFSEDVQEVIVWGLVGQMCVLPHHAPLMTVVKPGYIQVKKEDGADLYLAATGGFLEVLPDKVIILADACDRADKYITDQAEEALKRASWMLEETMKSAASMDYSAAEAALLRSLEWLKETRSKRPRKRAV
ncbi:MAG: ATP synthase F1 subunit epsilon [bacterium]|nr:ATP synthase F1 subunit epsilon [bacterium]